jgi:hypothetical protein
MATNRLWIRCGSKLGLGLDLGGSEVDQLSMTIFFSNKIVRHAADVHGCSPRLITV